MEEETQHLRVSTLTHTQDKKPVLFIFSHYGMKNVLRNATNMQKLARHMKPSSPHAALKSWVDKEAVRFKAGALYSTTLLSLEIPTQKCWKLLSDPERSPGSLFFHMTPSTAARRFIKGQKHRFTHTLSRRPSHTGPDGEVAWPVTMATGQQQAVGVFLQLLHPFLGIKRDESWQPRRIQRCEQFTLKQQKQNKAQVYQEITDWANPRSSRGEKLKQKLNSCCPCESNNLSQCVLSLNSTMKRFS